MYMDLKFILNEVDVTDGDFQSSLNEDDITDDYKKFEKTYKLKLSDQSNNENNENNNNNNNNNINNNINNVIPNQPSISANDIIPSNVPISAEDRKPKHINAFTAYRCEYIKQAELQGLNLRLNEASFAASRSWSNEDPAVRQLYGNIGHQAELNHLQHNAQFPLISYKCGGCECEENE